MINTYIINWHTVNHGGEPGQFGTTLIEAPSERSARRKLRSLYPSCPCSPIKVTEVKIYERPGL